MKKSNFFVITGGPGAGKTTLIEALAVRGYPTVEEAGRRIIREQKATGGAATHDGDRLAYRWLMFEDAVQTFEKNEHTTAPVFFDRGLPDLVGYSRLIGAPVPGWLNHALNRYRYNDIVFIGPPWTEIYGSDEERKQDFAEAVSTYEAMHRAYEEAGYRLSTLPKADVEERARFVIREIQAGGSSEAQSGKTPNSMPKTNGPSA